MMAVGMAHATTRRMEVAEGGWDADQPGRAGGFSKSSKEVRIHGLKGKD
jgi:hypothetical protein